jgi:hypothetical protein
VCSQVLHGWRFWSLQGTEKPKRDAKPKAEKPVKAKKEPAAKTKAAPKKSAKAKSAKKGKAKSAKKPKAHRAAATGDSFGCGVCPETFPTQKKAVAHALTHTA